MMNRLRKSASPASTWLGGVCCRPSALRVRPSTTKILVKLVQVSRIAGSSESSVSAMITVTEVLGLSVRPSRSIGHRAVAGVPLGPRGALRTVGLGARSRGPRRRGRGRSGRRQRAALAAPAVHDHQHEPRRGQGCEQPEAGSERVTTPSPRGGGQGLAPGVRARAPSR